MFTFNINFLINNYFKKKNDIKKLYHESKKYNLSVLPTAPDYVFENLYPISNHVEIWSIFVVGNDKNYILCNVDSNIKFENKDKILNTKGSALPEELFEFLNNVWDITLGGKNLQFFIVLDAHLYIFNSYYFSNERGKVIGATAFLRDFENVKIIDALTYK